MSLEDRRLPHLHQFRHFDTSMEEGADGGDGWEDIGEDLFDASQPMQRKRSLNYTELEDVTLIRAWEQVSLDAMIDNDQSGKKYWQ